jgi:hypothetical protein
MEDQGRSAIRVATALPIQALTIADPQHPGCIGADVRIGVAHW